MNETPTPLPKQSPPVPLPSLLRETLSHCGLVVLFAVLLLLVSYGFTPTAWWSRLPLVLFVPGTLMACGGIAAWVGFKRARQYRSAWLTALNVLASIGVDRRIDDEFTTRLVELFRKASRCEYDGRFTISLTPRVEPEGTYHARIAEDDARFIAAVYQWFERMERADLRSTLPPA